MAATHKGICQVCGSMQKLPNGRLAKHGYTTAHGFFEGTCMGSGALPYEQSCGLIRESIAAAENRLALNLAKQAELRAPATSNKAWINEYRTGNRRSECGYFWREVEVVETPFTLSDGTTVPTFSYVDYRGRNHKLYPSTGCRTLADVVGEMNVRRADHFAKVAESIRAYILSQTHRVNNWKPAELTPVK